MYRQFTTVYKLDKPFRQQGDTSFVELLSRLRHGLPSPQDVEMIRSRMQCNLSEFEIKSFDKAIRVFPYVKQVEDYNR